MVIGKLALISNNYSNAWRMLGSYCIAVKVVLSRYCKKCLDQDAILVSK